MNDTSALGLVSPLLNRSNDNNGPPSLSIIVLWGQYTARFIKIFSVSSSNMKVGDAIEKLADLRGEASMFKKKHDLKKKKSVH